MKILITNNALCTRSGSELYVQELAQALVHRGHIVAAFSTDIGELAQKMITQGVTVIDDLAQLPWAPDIIHAQHHLETMIALAYFPQTPAIYVCHGWRPWQEAPPLHPRIMTYFAVDTKTRDQAITKHGVPSGNIHIMHNFVDLDRFQQRAHLPIKPQKALVFSNYAHEGNFLPSIREACRKANVSLDVVGASFGNAVDKPENILGDYDLVFAVGRSALEALASGVAVVICGECGVGPMVTYMEIEKLRDLNFGVAAMYTGLDADVIYKEICCYNAEDAKCVTQYLRERIGLERTVKDLEKLYKHAIDAHILIQCDEDVDLHAHAKYLKKIAILLKQNDYNCSAMRENSHLHQERFRQKELKLEQKISEINLMRSSHFWKMRGIYMRFKKIFKGS